MQITHELRVVHSATASRSLYVVTQLRFRININTRITQLEREEPNEW